MTHAELVERAATWLRGQRCTVIITEMVSGHETPDAIGWHQAHTTLIECKVSKPDFRADQKKFFRKHGQYGIGSSRYYLTPPGLIDPTQLPQGWGLLEVHGKRTMLRQRSRPFHNKDINREVLLLLSCIRRIGQNAPPGVSVKFYTYRTKNTATLGVLDDGPDDFEPEGP